MVVSSAQAIKKLGELLLEAGFLSEVQLERAMEVSRKNFQSLGKVLVSTKTCTQADVNNALEIQKCCKLDGMSAEVAVRVLQLVRAHYLTPTEALERVGWLGSHYNPHQEPENIAAARQSLSEIADTNGLEYAQALENLADAFAEQKLGARAEVSYSHAASIYEQLMPDSVFELANLLSKLSRVAAAQNRPDDAKQLLARAKTCLEENGQSNSKEYAKLLHLAADMHVSQKNFSAAEQHYLDCFAMLEPVCGLDDPQVLDTVRRYVEIVNKGKKDTSKSVAAAKWREMSHESLPDKVTLGELLKGSRMVSERDLTASWQYSKETKIPLGRAFVDLKLITEKQLQMTLRAQLLVRNNEINAQLGIWLLLYATQLDLELDEVLELFQCVPRTQSPLADELKAASDKIQELEARLPPSHPDLAFAHAKQARFYFYRQQYVEADHHYKRGLEILSANSDVAAESLIELLDHYAQVKLALDDLPETVRLTKMAVQIRSKYYGNESVPYAKGVEKLAQVFCGAGDHHTAISIYQRALDVREKLYGPEDVEILPCLELKAECLVHENDLELAETMLDRCLALAQKEFGKQNAKTERIAKKLADVCKSLGKADKAKSIMPSQLKKNTLQLRKDNLF